LPPDATSGKTGVSLGDHGGSRNPDHRCGYERCPEVWFIYTSLVRKGGKIPINDVWIAACCMEVGGTLLTRDRHFEAVEQIQTMILPS
jgi:hypothetical protein